MTALADATARIRVLSDLGSTLLVEAAAGTGKTALIAGRLTMALLDGVAPRHLAAITYNEHAASELSSRIHLFTADLLAGRVPRCLTPVLPEGLTLAQHKRLVEAVGKLDELTVTTLHGFCQILIHSYAVEANIDPGARMMDGPQAAAAFEGVFVRWLRGRLTRTHDEADPIAALSQQAPRKVAQKLKALAEFRLKHLSARTPVADLTERLDIELESAVARFRTWYAQGPQEPGTGEVLDQLAQLAQFYAGAFARPPNFTRLWQLAHPPYLSACMWARSNPRYERYDLKRPQWKAAWKKAAGPQDGARYNYEAEAHFGQVNTCYQRMMGRIATTLVEILSRELDEVLAEYAQFKRAAAVLDFDDLLHRARELVQGHERVRQALGERYRHLLIDEFQDTDPVQAETLFRIAATEPAREWQHSALRPGALFAVGDPKQAIYGFRGADAGSYARARAAIERQWPGNVIQITTNFRSVPGILEYVNGHFETVFSGPRQPAYVDLTPHRPTPEHGLPCVAQRTLDLAPDSPVEDIRDAEAADVAEVCQQLIGSIEITDDHGARRVLEPQDIALLAPAGTELWRYERALESRRLPIAPRAGKAFFRRQETQDLLALTRTLADGADTLAFGALMRGPLVGLSDEDLLDISAELDARSEGKTGLAQFSVRTDPQAISHPVAREVLTILRQLRQRAYSTSPGLLLAEAVERLNIRALLMARDRNRRSRGVANLQAFLELARGYGVSGLKRFARDLNTQWAVPNLAREEGQVDPEGAIQMVTMHSSKGLEWPVVILINTCTRLWEPSEFVYRPDDNTLHWVLGDVRPPELTAALEGESLIRESERQRLLYVACTRARDLLILPHIPPSRQDNWSQVVQGTHEGVPELVLPDRGAPRSTSSTEAVNVQTAQVFAREHARIEECTPRIKWLKPSEEDPDRQNSTEPLVVDVSGTESPEPPAPIGAGRTRGLVLHKLMEEILTGEVDPAPGSLTARAGLLIEQLSTERTQGGEVPEPGELARTVTATLALPEIAALCPHLVPEVPLFGLDTSQTTAYALAGRADAVVMEGDRPAVVVDWKSDIAPGDDDIRRHATQLHDYMLAIGAPRGALVYMTQGLVHWVE